MTFPPFTSKVKSVTVVYPFGATTSDKTYLPSGTFPSVALSFSFVSHEIPLPVRSKRTFVEMILDKSIVCPSAGFKFIFAPGRLILLDSSISMSYLLMTMVVPITASQTARLILLSVPL